MLNSLNAPISKELAAAVTRLSAIAEVRRVVLFGSRARNKARPQSDFDLCVLLDDSVQPQRFTPVTLWQEIRHILPEADVIPMRESVFEEKRRLSNTLSSEIDRDGLVLFTRLAG